MACKTQKGLLARGALFVLLLVSCAGCSPKIVERIVVQHDTTTAHHRDTTYHRDSIYIREWMKGDTVYVDRFRDRYVFRDRWRDSIRVQHDTTAVFRTKEVQVEQPLSAWKRFKIGGFWWLLALAAVGWRKQLAWIVKKVASLFV